MSSLSAYKISIEGIVQAVGFRPFVYRIAVENNLSGWVKNLGDAGVAVFVQGQENDIQNFIEDLQEKHPPLAKIDRIETKRAEKDGSITEFRILESSSGSSGSGTIPPDIATCEDCLADVFGDSRYRKYWATSCVNCGPRFSVIRKLPYDRKNTSMDHFPLCQDCKEEYTDPRDRRHHAQTIACPQCGPRLWFTPANSTKENCEEPIKTTCFELEEGKIIAIKGLGGTHLACNALDGNVIGKLRERLKRFNQPFALMVTEDMARENLRFTPDEFKTLSGPRRPIVILENKNQNWVSKKVAPGLNSLGVMLPYTALHHLIFSKLSFPLVMTSANMPGEPMLIENDNIQNRLAEIADGFLLHDRKIVSRVDDSVIRFSGGFRKFIRRSRGWVPEPLEIDLGKRPILALGAERNNIIGLYRDKKVYLSQHLGNVDSPASLDFLTDSLDRLLKLTGAKIPEVVAHDLHPGFLTTKEARRLGEKAVPVQHHKAHLGSLLAEHDLAEIVGIVMDGVGYGEDGSVWGGEIMLGSSTGIDRLASLTPAYMPGGDLATRHPSRMVAGILYPLFEENSFGKFESLIHELDLGFPQGEKERKFTLEQLKKGLNVRKTTSSGRFLDAVSAFLGICEERNYEGEPAMKLESFARKGNTLEIELPINNNGSHRELNQAKLLEKLIQLRKHHPPEDVAATAQWALAEGMSQLAIKIAGEKNVKTVGFSGGVAYNSEISQTIESSVRDSGLSFVTNEDIPVGDGGIVLGQLWIAAH